MAFKTTQNRSHLRLVREVEAIGGNVLASGVCVCVGGGPVPCRWFACWQWLLVGRDIGLCSEAEAR